MCVVSGCYSALHQWCGLFPWFTGQFHSGPPALSRGGLATTRNGVLVPQRERLPAVPLQQPRLRLRLRRQPLPVPGLRQLRQLRLPPQALPGGGRPPLRQQREAQRGLRGETVLQRRGAALTCGQR